MIRINRIDYGSASEIAAALGPDVTVDMIRNWSRRDGLEARRRSGRTWYPLAAAATIEAEKRSSGRGRPRRVDDHHPAAIMK